MDGFRFATDLTVRFNETDAQGVVHNAVYLVWFEIARVAYLGQFPGGYKGLVEQGVARELARAVMPVGAYTEFYWTVNARALMNFVSLRAAETAQREIRRYADAVEQLFAEKMPVTHGAFVAAGRVAP